MTGPEPAVDRPPGDVAVALAQAAIAIAAGGDRSAAVAQLDHARSVARTHARRERQLVEIAAAVVDGDVHRAAGLAAEHRHEFPGDARLLDDLLRPGAGADDGW
jgi:hypothetical protein